MALPQGAFAACKLREQFQERDMILSRLRAANNADKADNNTQREYLPVKYNDKLMNSIWGLYNRYSPPQCEEERVCPAQILNKKQAQQLCCAVLALPQGSCGIGCCNKWLPAHLHI
ncbi:uncharacterized protein LOC132791973 [Drosophila nasuta]|uniref:uncharacterized protein LOC132791973 n=1 Tax=Drosophila nasuta TaxID=42062 RepID=UPI00295E3994|nr:uncharacterized protein LOC132791973 [Drosophila nasuta]